MPHASHKTLIDAPFDLVDDLLIDKMEKPKKYVGGILYSSVLERGDGYIIREMFEPVPSALTIREKIYRRPIPGGEEFVYEHMNNARYTGFFYNKLTHVEGRDDQCEVEYIMDWTPHAGTEEKIDPETAKRMVTAGVNHLKEMAEHPVEVPEIIKAFYGSVDSLDPIAMEPLLAENIKFRIGSSTELLGKAAVLKLNADFMGHLQSIKHHFVDVFHDRGRIFVECFVDYVLPDGKDYLLPFLTVFEQDGEKISRIRIYGDGSPLRHGWPAPVG